MILSVDDGCQSDVRIAELADKYDINVVFYWPVDWHSLAYDKGYEPLKYSDAWKIAGKHELGAHTITHRHLTSISVEDAKREILDSKNILQDIFLYEIDKFCPPRGYTNEELTEFTLQHYKSQRLTKGEHLVHVHPNSGANGNIPWLDYYQQHKDKITEAWCHSWEIDKYDQWEKLEEFLREVRK